MKPLIFTLFVFLFIWNTNGQSPNAFKYQTVIRDNAGNVIPNKTVTIQVSLIQGSITGTAVYSESHNPQTNLYGLVSLEIGNGIQPTGSFSAIDWANGPYFIKISINGTDVGTNQLLSVPYAKYADKAGNGFSGDYNDLKNKPNYFNGDWAIITGKPNFSAVAYSGSYNDLIDKPSLFDGTWASLTGKPIFSLVSTTGSYNDLNNKPDFSWSSITGKPNTLAGYGITDAMNISHPANNITSTNIANWNTAYSWGDHSTKGYALAANYYTITNLKTDGQAQVHWNNIISASRPTTLSGYGITDAMSSSHPANAITNILITNWNSAYSWGNHALKGYAKGSDYYSKSNLQTSGQAQVHWNNIIAGSKPTTLSGYGITDAMSTSHPANSITGSSISNWNTAFSWGDHSTQGYAKASDYYSKTELQTSGQSQVNWNNIQVSTRPTTLSGYGITNAMSTSHVANGIASSDISNWNTTYGWGDHHLAGYVDGTNYYTKVNLQTSGQASVHWGNITNKPTFASFGFSDVSVSSPANNQLLRYNSTTSKWENWTPSFLTSESQTLSLSGITLSISGGNSVLFTNWDTDNSDDATLTGDQTIAGNKTFTGTVTTATIINANGGVNANNAKVTHVADPTNNSDAATKAYVDALIARIAALESKLGL